MKIAIFGMGYVGVTTAACLAKFGHEIAGVELSAAKVSLINRGESPIVEAGISELVSAAVRQGWLRATDSASEGLAGSSIAIICVGTPSRPNGSLNTGFLTNAVREIGTCLAAIPRDSWPLIVVRSTIFPGTVRNELMPVFQETCGTCPKLAYHPEFLREGSSVADFFEPPKIVIGTDTPDEVAPLLSLYETIEAPRFTVSIETAELAKYADNAFHALKITFGNEIGRIAQASGVDSRQVMDVFLSDRKLNISTKYLRPGFAFGGSCLPKDLRALTYASRAKGVQVPVLENILASNSQHLERAVRLIADTGARSIGMAGLAFKEGTDDLRESPLVELAERLVGKGTKLTIYDACVQAHRLVGKNKTYIDETLPHLAQLLVQDISELGTCDAVILGHRFPKETAERFLSLGKTVIDLTGESLFPENSRYIAIV